MQRLRLTCLVLLGAALLIGPGCVELTGQRITWFYDSVEDELQILIHYDGIHDSGSDQHGKGIEQVPEFVRDGDLMILDWPFRFKMAEVREKLEDKDAEPKEKQWARLIASIKTKPVGYYREPDGRIGAAQLVTIPKAQDFVRKLNGLLSEEILEQSINPKDPLARTQERIQAAAKDGHQWVTLDGHAIRFAVPVHPDEWARCKGEFLKEVADEVVKMLGEEADEEEKKRFRSGLKLLAAAPLSYIDEGDRVEFVLGTPKTPSTFRLEIRDEYQPNLEKVVADSVKVDLDKALALALLGKAAEPSAAFSAVVSWGPPEEQVRALIVAAGSDDQQQKQAAIERLRRWAKQWSRDHVLPEAPTKADEPDDYLVAWKKWYGLMKQYPVFAEEKENEEEEDAAKPADPQKKQ